MSILTPFTEQMFGLQSICFSLIKWCFTALFQAAGAGEYWMITADPGQRGFATGSRSIVLQAPNAGSLIDFSAGVLQAPGGNASTSNWSDDGQPPSAMESTQLAGEHQIIAGLDGRPSPGTDRQPVTSRELRNAT